MKRLILAVAIALLSTAATTAWSHQTEQTGPTEQETKDFIVETLGNCKYVKAAEFEGSNLHLNAYVEQLYGNLTDGSSITFTLSFNGIVPAQNLKEVSAVLIKEDNWYIRPDTELKFKCKATNDGCMGNGGSEKEIATCSHETHEVLAKAFNHLIGIYDAERPKPLFE